MTRSSRTFFCLLLVLICAASLGAQQYQITAVKDLDYVPGVEYADGKDRLDLYIPKGVTGAPVILSIHGGALSQGDRTEEVYVGERFARAGYVTAVISYRLSPDVSHPAHIQDVAAAFAWVKRNINRYSGDPNRIILIGHSAGAYLAALLASDPRYLAAHKLSPKDMKGIVPVSGFFWVDKPGVAPDRPKDVWGEDPKVWIDASPPRYLRADHPPVLLLYTDGDEDWRRRQNEDMAAAYRSAGVKDVGIRRIDGRTHMSVWTDMSAGQSEETSSAIVQFAKRILSEKTK